MHDCSNLEEKQNAAGRHFAPLPHEHPAAVCATPRCFSQGLPSFPLLSCQPYPCVAFRLAGRAARMVSPESEATRFEFAPSACIQAAPSSCRSSCRLQNSFLARLGLWRSLEGFSLAAALGFSVFFFSSVCSNAAMRSRPKSSKVLFFLEPCSISASWLVWHVCLVCVLASWLSSHKLLLDVGCASWLSLSCHRWLSDIGCVLVHGSFRLEQVDVAISLAHDSSSLREILTM